jgi:hypothetical protein
VKVAVAEPLGQHASDPSRVQARHTFAASSVIRSVRGSNSFLRPSAVFHFEDPHTVDQDVDIIHRTRDVFVLAAIDGDLSAA